ncbi:hypothetical protein N8I77_001063 [Diaporthe amygdali]|uniref:Uncharacterized protein n=1 Tax=Phomopsis amygdali TaxID=1214568 RepID=A0AAD9SQW6_PHOAM|nr:hypothetical protein N8I77_001063 [Diaporthe amygdali]
MKCMNISQAPASMDKSRGLFQLSPNTPFSLGLNPQFPHPQDIRFGNTRQVPQPRIRYGCCCHACRAHDEGLLVPISCPSRWEHLRGNDAPDLSHRRLQRECEGRAGSPRQSRTPPGPEGDEIGEVERRAEHACRIGRAATYGQAEHNEECQCTRSQKLNEKRPDDNSTAEEVSRPNYAQDCDSSGWDVEELVAREVGEAQRRRYGGKLPGKAITRDVEQKLGQRKPDYLGVLDGCEDLFFGEDGVVCPGGIARQAKLNVLLLLGREPGRRARRLRVVWEDKVNNPRKKNRRQTLKEKDPMIQDIQQ